jgi:hypothetical protein
MSNRDDKNIDIERKMDTKNTVFFISKYIAYPILYQNILGYFLAICRVNVQSHI